jgi:hypothetical protein
MGVFHYISLSHFHVIWLQSTEHEKILARNRTYAHARDFATSDGFLLAMLIYSASETIQ